VKVEEIPPASFERVDGQMLFGDGCKELVGVWPGAEIADIATEAASTAFGAAVIGPLCVAVLGGCSVSAVWA
jgi:hypothetical protein